MSSAAVVLDRWVALGTIAQSPTVGTVGRRSGSRQVRCALIPSTEQWRIGRTGLNNGTAVDVLWLLMSPDNYYRLVHQRRWTKERYQQWLAASIAQLLFAKHP